MKNYRDEVIFSIAVVIFIFSVFFVGMSFIDKKVEAQAERSPAVIKHWGLDNLAKDENVGIRIEVIDAGPVCLYVASMYTHDTSAFGKEANHSAVSVSMVKVLKTELPVGKGCQ